MKSEQEIIEEIKRLTDCIIRRLDYIQSNDISDEIIIRYEKEMIEIFNDIKRLEWVLEN